MSGDPGPSRAARRPTGQPPVSRPHPALPAGTARRSHARSIGESAPCREPVSPSRSHRRPRAGSSAFGAGRAREGCSSVAQPLEGREGLGGRRVRRFVLGALRALDGPRTRPEPGRATRCRVGARRPRIAGRAGGIVGRGVPRAPPRGGDALPPGGGLRAPRGGWPPPLLRSSRWEGVPTGRVARAGRRRSDGLWTDLSPARPSAPRRAGGVRESAARSGGSAGGDQPRGSERPRSPTADGARSSARGGR